jgi:6-phospho-beta-glucosidase
MYADPARDRKPDLLGQRGGAYYSEAAVALLASLAGDRRDTQVVNVRNAGTFPFLPGNAVIEVPAVIGAGGARPARVAPLSPLLAGLIAHVSAYEELAVDAAVRGGRSRVLAALLAHPLVGQFDIACKLADRLIAENSRYLDWAVGAAR